MQIADDARLAIHGGAPAKQHPDPPMYPGGMAIDEEEEAAVLEVLRSKRLFRYYGPTQSPSKTDELERSFAEAKGVRHALGVTSGTAALVCALHGVGVGSGDEVIIPAYTWIATATAVLAVGAVPVMAEVDESLLIDPVDFEAKISPYTKAVIAVHMRGAPCAMDEILAVARRHGLSVIEDCAQANGATYQGREVGSFGDVGCFSLQFNKIVTSGEGGMLTADSLEIYQRAAMFHDVNTSRHRLPEASLLWGINFRMPELLAAVALVQMRKLPGLLNAMRARKRMLKAGIAATLDQKGLRFRAIHDEAGDAAIATVFFMQTAEQAQAVGEALRAENIGASVLYRPEVRDYHIYAHWVPVMEQRAWSPGGDPWRWAQRPIEYHADMCPTTLDLLGRAVHLNVSPLLNNEDVEETIEGVNRVLNTFA